MDPASAEALKPLYDTLDRYAGWLDRDRTSVLVRADVRALGLALDACADPAPLLQSLDVHIARLPSGGIRKMLRVAANQIRRALAEAP
jgi:hypothetical protein